MFIWFTLQSRFIAKRLVIAALLQAVSTCLLVTVELSGVGLRHGCTTSWNMSKISVPSNTALALWASSNHECLFLRSRHWAGSLRRHCFETILINEPLRDGWVHEAEI
jgi:hypothetical protein